MPRVKLFDEEQALNKAMEIFWEKGYNSTSLTDLTQGLKISKGSFYDTFSNKRALFEQAFELYRESNLAFLEQLLRSEADVRTGIRKMLEFTVIQNLKDSKSKGCLAANTCTELGNRDAEIKAILTQHYARLKTTLANYIKQDEGIKNPEAKAGMLVTIMNGINQEVKIKDDEKEFQQTIDLTMKLFE